MYRRLSIALTTIIFISGCGSATSSNQSPMATENEFVQSQEETAKREAQAQQDEAEFFKRKAQQR